MYAVVVAAIFDKYDLKMYISRVIAAVRPK